MIKRTTRKVPPHTPCGYCFSKWATGWDHLIPWSYRPDDSPINLYPSCKGCNSLLYNKMFATLREKREYVRAEFIRRGEWKLPELWQELPQEEGAPEILRGILSLEGMGSAKPSQQKTRADSPDSVAPVLVRETRSVRRRREAQMRQPLRDAEKAKIRLEAAFAANTKGVHSRAGEIYVELIQCAWKECLEKFPAGLANNRNRLFCSDSCRAKASEEAKFKRRLAHKIPELTADRRAVKLAAAWLAGRVKL